MRWIRAVSCLAVILFNFFCTYAGSFKVLKILIIFINIQLCLWSMVYISDQTKLPAIRRDHTIWGRVFTCLQHFFGMRHLPNLHSARSIFMSHKAEGRQGLSISLSDCWPSSCLSSPQTRRAEDHSFEPVHTCLMHTRKHVYSFEISQGNNCIALSGSGQGGIALLLQHVLDLYFLNILLGDVQ